MNASLDEFGAITAVIFDMDGLLLDTEGIYTEVTQIISDRYSGRRFDWSLKQHTIGLGARELASYIIGALELPMSIDEYLQARAPLMDERFPRAQAMAGAEMLVRHLSANKVPIAVGTSSSKHFFDLKTTLHKDWFALFDTVVTADDPQVGAAKPAPDIFLVAAQRLGIAPAQCIVFEDSPFGITAAKAAGMYAIAVPDSGMPAEKFAHADRVIRSLESFQPQGYGLPAR
jgi:pseudouridine-5'-monophosphatase